MLCGEMMQSEGLVKVVDVEASIRILEEYTEGSEEFTYESIETSIKCFLEDGRSFMLYTVPIDVVEAIRRLKGEESMFPREGDERETFFDVITTNILLREALGKYLSKVIIDSLDVETYTYAAIAEFVEGGIIVKRRMIPSHAILMALVAGKPVYIKRELVDQQEAMTRT